MIIAALITTAGIYIYSRRNLSLNLEMVWFTAFISVATMPFLLPKMHDRYFYPADVFSIILAFFIPQFWFIPVCYQVISSLVYSIFLFDAPRSTMLILATELNTIVIAYLTWKQIHLLKDSKDAHENW
jgi:Gpi18-like mannosyltransferase